MRKYSVYSCLLALVISVMFGLYGIGYAADTKVSGLGELAVGGIANSDGFYVIDATGPTSTKYLWSSLKADMKTYMDGLYTTTTMANDPLWGAAGDLVYGTADNTGARLVKGTAYQLLQMNSGATAPEWTSTLSLASLNLSSATSSVPWPVGAGTASNTAEGSVYWESDTDMLTIGDAATGISLDFTAGAVYTFPSLSASLAPLTSPTFVTSVALPATLSSAAAVTWTLMDNQASGISFGATGSADILKIGTQDAGPQVSVAGRLSATTYGSDGTVSDAELLYLGDVTSAIQAQFTNKAPLAAPVFTTSIEAPFLILGTAATAADAGAIRLPNAAYIMAEADAAGTDISVIGVDSAEIVQIGASGASAVTITPNTTITGTLSAGSGGFTVDADGDMVAKSITATASATPSLTFNDSDNAAGTAGLYGMSSGGANDIIMSLGVEDSGSDTVPTVYIEIDGVTETVDIKKPLVIEAAQFKIPSSNADPTTTAGYFRHDSTITNFTNGGLVYYNGAAIKQVVDMTTATATACTDGQAVIYDATDDLWKCGTVGGSGDVSTDTIWDAAGDLVIGTGSNTAHRLSAGATTTILVGGGAADPVWTTATGTGAPVRANTPTLITPVIGAATGTSLALTGALTGLMPPVNVLVPSGTSTDVPSETVLTHADDGSASNAYVGMTLYNVTDGVSGTVTASNATTITVGAGSMSWANTNVYQLGPGPSQSGSMFYVGTAGTIRHPATAGYVAGYYVNVAGVVTVDMASDSMIFQGVLSSAFATLDAGDCIDSPATKGSYYIIHNKSATEAIGFGSANVWVDGGAS